MDNTQLSFHGRNSILGRGVVVHEKADDLKTPPAGNAGARLACWGGRCRQALTRSSGGGEGTTRPRIIRSGALVNRGLRVSGSHSLGSKLPQAVGNLQPASCRSGDHDAPRDRSMSDKTSATVSKPGRRTIRFSDLSHLITFFSAAMTVV